MRLCSSPKVARKYTILAEPVWQWLGKSGVRVGCFRQAGHFAGGYTRVTQKCDGLAERVGGTGVKIRCYRKRRSWDEVGQEFLKSSPRVHVLSEPASKKRCQRWAKVRGEFRFPRILETADTQRRYLAGGDDVADGGSLLG